MKEFGQWFSESGKSVAASGLEALPQTSLQETAHKAWAALSECVDLLYAPDANCSCHISPPCRDCVDHAGTRSVLEAAHEAIAALKKELAP